MKLAPSIKKETGHIALGVLIGDAVMLAVFALLKRLDYTVVLGAALGSAAAILNFLFMAMNLQKAMDDPDRAKLLVQKSYTQRMLGMVVVMIMIARAVVMMVMMFIVCMFHILPPSYE